MDVFRFSVAHRVVNGLLNNAEQMQRAVRVQNQVLWVAFVLEATADAEERGRGVGQLDEGGHQSVTLERDRRQAFGQIARDADGLGDESRDVSTLAGSGFSPALSCWATVSLSMEMPCQMLPETVMEVVTDASAFLVADFQNLLFQLKTGFESFAGFKSRLAERSADDGDESSIDP